jgi:RND family efflux transporter MFP subunit
MRHLFLSLLLGACSGGAAADQSAAPPPALVQVASAQPGSLSDRWTVPGDVRALDRAELAAGAAGPVAEVSVREGDRVTAGQTLLQIDAAPAVARAQSLRAAADETVASLAKARKDRDRIEQVSDSVLAEAERDAARAEVATLEARLRSQRAAAREAGVAVARHEVQAPFDGVVAARHVDRGDWVTVGQRVLDLVSVDQVDVRVDAARELADQVGPGDSVSLGTAAGHVVAVVPSLDPVTRTSVVRLVPDDGAHGLVPGSTIPVGFQVERRAQDGALVPRDALVLGPVDTKVVRVAEGHADIVIVQVLATSAELALVEGISPGDSVVVRGAERLRPGQALNVAAEPAP